MPPSGWAMTPLTSSWSVSDEDTSSASSANASVQIVNVWMPRRWSSYESWKLHDVHAPQSPVALMAAWQSRAILSSIA